MNASGPNADAPTTPPTPARSRQQRQELLDQVRLGQVSIEAVLTRADTDPIIARTEVRQLVEAFLWHADTGAITSVLIRAGITAGRRVRGLARWQRTVLISALG